MNYLNVRTMEKSKGLQPSDLSPVASKPQESIVHDQGYNMRQDSDISVPENVILQTTNYGMFKFDPLNRVIRQDKLDRLYDAVQTRNLLHLFPIVASRDLVVIDGQHRLKVAEALAVPIYYIVSNQMKIEDAAFVNTNTDGWRMEDYMDHWCKVGAPGYLALREFWGAHKWLTLSTAVSLCFYGGVMPKATGDRKTLHRAFSAGEYVPNDISFAVRVCEMAKDFSPWVKFWKDVAFLSALRNLASNADYDHRRMIQKMQWQSSKLVRCANMDGYISVLNEIYNFKVPDDRKVMLRKLNPLNPKYRTDRKQK